MWYTAGSSGREEYSLWIGDGTSDKVDENHDAEFSNLFASDVSSSNVHESQIIDIVPSSEVEEGAGSPQDMYLPGLVVHIVSEPKISNNALWTSWRLLDKENHFKAYIADREKFKDIIISPSMFLDHLPWRYDKLHNLDPL